MEDLTEPEYDSNEDYELVEASTESTKQMKIVHTTHDVATRGRSTSRPKSATQKMKDYFSIRTNDPSVSKEEDEEPLIQPDPEIRERRASETQVGTEPGICAFLINEHKELKRKQREKRMFEASKVRLERANEKASTQIPNCKFDKKPAKIRKPGYGCLQEVGSPPENKRFSSLRRMKSFGDMKEAKIQANVKPKTHGDDHMHQMRAQRQAIREGKLERVVPPSSSSREPKLTLKCRDASPSKPAHKKSASTSSKLVSYMETSADILDATRRDLTSNLRKSAEKAEKLLASKFDQLGRYSSGHGNNWDNDSDSDESFYCIGERRFSEIDRARRISVDGTDPWIDGPQEECRLCRKPSPAGVRGLCRDCEKEFRRPKTTVFIDSDDEVKPTPPLKIKNTKTTCANVHKPSSGERVLTGKINQVGKKPQLVTPRNHISQQVCIEDGSYTHESETEYVSRYEQWQSPDIRAKYQSQENESSRWSPRLLEDNQVSTQSPSLRSKFNKSPKSAPPDRDDTPLVDKENPQSNRTRSPNDVKRSESFYGYWDEVLQDDGARIIKRDSRYQRI